MARKTFEFESLADDSETVSFELEWDGEAEVVENLLEAETRIQQVAAAALFERASGMMALAKDKAPVDTGRLMRSGGVSNPWWYQGQPAVSLFFGTHYAPTVHETHPTDSDYLWSAIKAKQGGFEDQMQKAFDDFLGREDKRLAILSAPTPSGEAIGEGG